MKEILKKLAALADEADTAGHAEVANQIDGIIKTFAAFDPVGEQLDKEHLDSVKSRNVTMPAAEVAVKKETYTAPEETVVSRPEAVNQIAKNRSVKEQHEKARQHMAQIAKTYTDSGRPAPFAVPAPGKATGQQILDFLNKAGKGGPLASWNDMFARLNEIDGDAKLFVLNMKKDPFGSDSSTMVAGNQFESLPPGALKANIPGEMDFLPGEERGKGPPKPPRGM